MPISHSYVVTGADDPDYEVSKDEWNNAHTITGAVDFGTAYFDYTEQSAPSNPSANVVRLYAIDSSGVSKLAYRDSAGTETIIAAGAAPAGSSGRIQYNAGSGAFGATNMERVSANYIDQHSTTTAQAFRIYKTTDGTNYERFILDWVYDGSNLVMGTEKGGTGTVRDVHFIRGTEGAVSLRLVSAGLDLKIGGNSVLEASSTTVSLLRETGTPAGGTTGTGLLFHSEGNFGIFAGSGAPTLSAVKGSLYLRTDGTSTTTRIYVHSGAGWTYLTAGA